MGRIAEAVKVLLNGKEEKKILFGFSAAARIFEATKGRYSSDESKAVPFAIISTAQALGARITVHEEGKEVITALRLDTKRTLEHTERSVQASEERIAGLLKTVEKENLSIATAKESAEKTVRENGARIGNMEAVLDFFTI